VVFGHVPGCLQPDLSPMPTYCVTVLSTYSHDHLKIGTRDTPALHDIYTNFGFSEPFSFRVTSLYKTDGRAIPVLQAKTII